MNDRFSLEGRVAVITGGGTGIGRGSALVLAEHGADVVLAGRRPDPLESTAKEAQALGDGHSRCPPTSPPPKHAGTYRRNAAGVRADRHPGELCGGRGDKVHIEMARRRLRTTLALNFGAVWYLSRAAATPMIKQGKGAIVNISSGRACWACRTLPRTVRQGGRQQLDWVDGRRVGSQRYSRQCDCRGAVRAATLTDDAAR